MRIYVATSIRNKEWAAETCSRLESLGHTITYDWSRSEHNKKDDTLTPEEALRAAVSDLYVGVHTADLIICHAGFEVMLGAPIEIGAAVAWGKRVWVLKPYRYSVFWELPQIEWIPSEEKMWEELGWPS